MVDISVDVSAGSADACAIADLGTTHAIKNLVERGVQYLPSVASDAHSLRRLHACALLDDESLRRVPSLDPTRRVESFGGWGCTWGNDDDAGFKPPSVFVDFQWTGRRTVHESDRQIQAGGRDVYIGTRQCAMAILLVRLIVHRNHPFSNGAPAQENVYFRIGCTTLPDAEKCKLAEDFASIVVSRLPPP